MLTIDRVAEVFGGYVGVIVMAVYVGYVALGNYLFEEKKQSSQ